MGTAKAGQSSLRGFTFALSALLIALTLISMAFFASQWRKSQEVSYNEVLPSDAAHLQDKIAGDFSSLSGANAQVARTGASSALVQLSFSLPLKKEGAQVLDLSHYSQALASSLRGSGVEAAVSSGVSGSSPTIMTLPDSGALALENDGTSDMMTYSHPLGWQPVAVNVSFFCNKRVASMGNISVQSGGGSAVTYNIVFREQGGRSFSQSVAATTTSNATLNITFDDGSQIAYLAQLSPGSQNVTIINYTKSPGAYLVLPFDANVSLAAGGMKDYSIFGNNFTLGGGVSANAPAISLSTGCRAGSCYVFNGSNQLISGSLPNVTQAGGVPGTQNFGFETTYNVSG